MKINNSNIHDWKLLIENVDDCDIFPSSEEAYKKSMWNRWEDRILLGHNAAGDKLTDKWIKNALRPKEELQWLVDENQEMCNLTELMYASMVASIWPQMRYVFKKLISVCNDDLIIESTFILFENIKLFFKSELSIELENFKNYNIIEAIYILHCIYNHSGDYYTQLSSEQDIIIEQTLLNRWNLLGEKNQVNYSNLPVMELILTCSSFAHELISIVKSKLGT